MFERYRDADAGIEHVANIGHLVEPIMATATIIGEVLETPNAKMWENPGKDGGAKLFTPWLVKEPERLAPAD